VRKKDEELCETSRWTRQILVLACALALGCGAFVGCLNPRPEELPSGLESAPSTEADDASRQSGPATFDAPAAADDGAEAAPENLVPRPTAAEAPPPPSEVPVGDAGADAATDSDAGAD
jgi:hypothetical protein